MNPSDRSVLTKLASALPQSSEERAALQGLLSREASVKAQEPYQKVEGHPYGGRAEILKLHTERELRVLSKLLNQAFGKMTPALEKKLSRYGVSADGIAALEQGSRGGGYMLYLTDATGEEYDVYNDLGIE